MPPALCVSSYSEGLKQRVIFFVSKEEFILENDFVSKYWKLDLVQVFSTAILEKVCFRIRMKVIITTTERSGRFQTWMAFRSFWKLIMYL